jgi:hypothetical protein
MQGALASPNLVTFQRNEISPDRFFRGGAGQGRAGQGIASSIGERGTERAEEKDTHGSVRRRRIGSVELKRVRALVLPR